MRPLRPFPLALYVGTDVCRISRIRAILDGPRRARFVRRILTPEERAQAGRRLGLDGDVDVDVGGGARGEPLQQAAVFLAGRFAAKEAAIKAHPHRRLTLHDVIIERARDDAGAGAGAPLGSGPPVARIREPADCAHDSTALVSISHDGDYATAVCLAHGGGAADDAAAAGGRVGAAHGRKQCE